MSLINSFKKMGGIFRLTVSKEAAKNDYERCDEFLSFIQTIPLCGEKALILGEGPLWTSFWYSGAEALYLVRIFACESGTVDDDFDKIMRNISPEFFENPQEAIEFDVSSSRLVMFDSANDGTDIVDKVVSVEIEPGRYRILTQTYEPDLSCFLILHRFDKLP